MPIVNDVAILERVLMMICAEAASLRTELEALASELRAEERDRFEGTLNAIQATSARILMELPAVTVN